MEKLKRPYAEQQISCGVCLQQIPPNQGKSFEEADYFLNFCGLNCYEQWRSQKNAIKKK